MEDWNTEIKPKWKNEAYVSQSMGSSLWERCFNNLSERSLITEVTSLWSCFLLTGNLAFRLPDNSPTGFESPPERTSVANLTSNKTCKTPFSDTSRPLASLVRSKSSKIPIICTIKYSQYRYTDTSSIENTESTWTHTRYDWDYIKWCVIARKTVHENRTLISQKDDAAKWNFINHW